MDAKRWFRWFIVAGFILAPPMAYLEGGPVAGAVSAVTTLVVFFFAAAAVWSHRQTEPADDPDWSHEQAEA